MSSSLLSSLGLVCPACDHYNSPGSAKCISCSADLNAAAKVAGRASGRASGISTAEGAPPVPPLAPPKPAATPKWGITILAGHAAGQRFRLGGAGCIIGRTRGAVLLPEDPYVSPAHAALIAREGRLFVRDDASVSGVFISISDQAALAPLDSFAVGNHLFRYLGALDPIAPRSKERPRIYGAPVPTGEAVYGIEEVLVGARPGRSAVTTGPVFAIGQRACEWAIPDDPEVAPRHCELKPDRARTVLRDLSGGKGTFLRIRPGVEHPLVSGARLRIGMHLLKVDSIA